MSSVIKFVLFVFAALAATGIYKILPLFEAPPVPKLESTWWGAGSPSAADSPIKPFKISVSDEVLKDLKYRLQHARPLVEPLQGIQQQYGMNSKLTKQIVNFWLNEYNWKERETYLNRYPQFTTKIQGLNIHYIHVKPQVSKEITVYPMMMIHGWPGSIREFYDIIPFLTTPQKGRNFVFELIIPSLPGYGFSEAATKPGLGSAQMAVVMKNLMKRLNFDRYYLQGGDFGAIIIDIMGILYPDHVIGVHSNMCNEASPKSMLQKFFYSFKPSLIVEEKYEHLVYPMSNVISKLLGESGYLHLQATKPDTVGTALQDSPVGLAAYILEKFTTWTNPEFKNLEDGGLTKKFTMTDLLDNVMIYWITNSITTSFRLYAESFKPEYFQLGFDRIPVKLPTACARFVHDLMYVPTALLENKYHQLLQVKDYEGGHFAAMEEPYF